MGQLTSKRLPNEHSEIDQKQMIYKHIFPSFRLALSHLGLAVRDLLTPLFPLAPQKKTFPSQLRPSVMSVPCSSWIDPHSPLFVDVLFVSASLTCTSQATHLCAFSAPFRKQTTSLNLRRLLLAWCSSQGKGNISRQPSLLDQWCWFNVLLLHDNPRTGI